MTGLEKAFKELREMVDNGQEAAETVTDTRQESLQAHLESTMAQRNIPIRHREPLKGESPQAWLKTLEELSRKAGTGYLNALVGVRGCGKTQIGVELLKTRPGWFCCAVDFFLDLRATYRKDATETEQKVLQRYNLFPLLVMDEVQERSETKWEDTMLGHLLNMRYNSKRDTLLISNLKPAEFSKSLGASVISRMHETGGIIECNWESFRKA